VGDPCSRRLEHADGSFAGVVLATIKIDFVRRFYKSLDVGRSGSVFLALGDGTLLLRTPFDSANIGVNVSKGPIFGLLKSKGPVGSAMLVARVDGIERMYSYRRLPTYPLLVSVGRSKQEVLADWRTTTTVLSVGLALLIAVLLTLGVRVVRQIGYRDRLERELGEAKAALESSNAALTSLAFNDGLTGLANRRHFEKALHREWRIARRSGALALVMIDADHFKQYNDLYGHPAGDQCLRTIARAIESGLRRPGDLAARYGGEEFAVLLPATDLAGARAVAETIRAAVQDAKLEHRGNPAGIVTISAGVCTLVPTAAANNPLALVREADRALYAAKAEGRNRVAWGPLLKEV
jgi:diguanylate cyclase (GGDEF)-like protein